MTPLLWTQVQDIGPSARASHAMAYGDGRTLLFGGGAGGTRFEDTWEWRGENWLELTDIGPGARSRHALAFDSVRNRVVLFGGGEGEPESFLGDTWEWDGEWTQVQDVGPSPRAGHAVAFDIERQRIVLFGGISSGVAPLADTWSWDGEDWVEVEDIGPPARLAHVLAYDAVRRVTVLFGGARANGGLFGDTWTWDGEHWTQAQDVGPPPTRDAALASVGTELILFGGLAGDPPSSSGTTWSWDGNDWTQRQNIGPSRRSSHAIAYDPSRQRVVVFGGVDTDASPLRDTWELATTGDPGEPLPDEREPILAAFGVSPTTIRPLGTFTVTVQLAAPGNNLVNIVIESESGGLQRRMTIPPNETTQALTIENVPLPLGSHVLLARVEGDPSPPKTANLTVEIF